MNQTLTGVMAIALLAGPAHSDDAAANSGAPAAAPSPAAAVAPVVEEASKTAEADALMAKRDLKSAEKALALYQAALKADDGNLDLSWKVADCLNFIMRKQTDGNVPLVEGMGDTPANRKIWATHGPEAYRLAKKVAVARPKDINAQGTLAEAFMFQSSAFGIIKAITSGAASEFKANAERLITLKTKHESGVGYIYLSGFYVVAPWPISDLDDAADYADKALAVEGKSARNQYYVGLVALKKGDKAKALKHFEQSLASPCNEPADNDVCSAYRREAKKGVELAKK